MPKTILVVEDEPSLLEAIKLKLEDRGYGFLLAANVDTALKYIKEGKDIDAVWLDHYLPGRNGLDLVIYMKDATQKYKDTPIFLISNSASQQRIYQYLQLGINGYFLKTEKSLDDIVDNIEALIGK